MVAELLDNSELIKAVIADLADAQFEVSDDDQNGFARNQIPADSDTKLGPRLEATFRVSGTAIPGLDGDVEYNLQFGTFPILGNKPELGSNFGVALSVSPCIGTIGIDLGIQNAPWPRYRDVATYAIDHTVALLGDVLGGHMATEKMAAWISGHVPVAERDLDDSSGLLYFRTIGSPLDDVIRVNAMGIEGESTVAQILAQIKDSPLMFLVGYVFPDEVAELGQILDRSAN